MVHVRSQERWADRGFDCIGEVRDRRSPLPALEVGIVHQRAAQWQLRGRSLLGTQKLATGDTLRLSIYLGNFMHTAEKTVLVTGANRGVAIPDDLSDLNKE